jgi:DNA-binding HxlR family transcriptional regulator
VTHSREERAACPLYTAIKVIDGRWKPMLFQRIALHPSGFGELKRSVPGVSARVLRQQLRQMEADGLIGKRILTPRHRGVRYRVTRYGRTLEPVFETLWRWGRRHVARRNTAGTLATAPRTIAIPS